MKLSCYLVSLLILTASLKAVEGDEVQKIAPETIRTFPQFPDNLHEELGFKFSKGVSIEEVRYSAHIHDNVFAYLVSEEDKDNTQVKARRAAQVIFIRCPRITAHRMLIHLQPRCKLIYKQTNIESSDYIKKVGTASHKDVDCTLITYSMKNKEEKGLKYGLFCSQKEHRLTNKLVTFKTDGIISGDLQVVEGNLIMFQAALNTGNRRGDKDLRLAAKSLKFPSIPDLEGSKKEKDSKMKKLASKIFRKGSENQALNSRWETINGIEIYSHYKDLSVFHLHDKKLLVLID